MPNTEILFSSTEENIMNYMLYLAGVSATCKALSRFHHFEHIPAVIYICAATSCKHLILELSQ
jgi:hypothetical protein